ncbi:DUF4352 domain-containing protein [Staphylococcus sp. SQ8-PEA]|uniref:DUF4352 domain-containing protein n=1 Tax=Staphylococcus marylandisciuri TaxID=2981529 RepID=A0ABT2QS64_9STAP|nr:DUF4352 domain-containing protein [Staphylococcus marylandisciuri]MCU5746818.1 DUF4352 domain-containing protein [Staphylococcus marylandisciuri]
MADYHNKSKQEQREWVEFQEYKRRQQHKRPKRGWLLGLTISAVILLLLSIGIISIIFFIKGDTPFTQPVKSEYKMGETAKNGDLNVTVNSATKTNVVNPTFMPTYPKGQFITVNVRIKNKGNEALTVDSTMFKLKSEGKTLQADSSASTAANIREDGSGSTFFLEQINPDSSASGQIVFDVSSKVANSKDKKLEISSTLFSSKSVTFDISKLKSDSKNVADEKDSKNEDANSTVDENNNYNKTPTAPSQGATERNHSAVQAPSQQETSANKAKPSTNKKDDSSAKQSESPQQNQSSQPTQNDQGNHSSSQSNTEAHSNSTSSNKPATNESNTNNKK